MALMTALHSRQNAIFDLLGCLREAQAIMPRYPVGDNGRTAEYQHGHGAPVQVGGNKHLLKELGYEFEQSNDIVYLWSEEQQKGKEPP